MGWQNPAADLAIVLIDQNAVAVDNVNFGVSIEIVGDVCERAGHEDVPVQDVIIERAEVV